MQSIGINSGSEDKMELILMPIILIATLTKQEYSVGTLAEIFVAIGTVALAVATYGSTSQGHKQAKRDRIAREMDLLILPLMRAFREIDYGSSLFHVGKLNSSFPVLR
jgi:hypothetical protein